MKYFLLFFSIFMLAACTTYEIVHSKSINIPEVTKPIYDTEKVINDISVGMPKSKVVSILGYPLTTEADHNLECLTYPLTTSNKESFVLLFKDGILTKYNKKQDCVDFFK